MVNRILGNLLRCLVGDKPGNWVEMLAQVQFTYKNSMNKSIGKTPFEIVCSMKPRGISNLKDIGKRSVEGEEFAKYMSSLHKDVKLKSEKINHKYKENANKRRRHHDFEIGDEVMVHLKIGRFPIRTYSKLKMRNFGLCKILKKFDNQNAY